MKTKPKPRRKRELQTLHPADIEVMSEALRLVGKAGR